MPKPLFSFIFVNYRSAKELKGALESIAPLVASGNESIVVNNDTSEAQEIDQLAQQYGARVRHTGKNVGFAVANNLGAEMAEGKIFFFMNPDARYESGSLQGLSALFDCRPRAIFGTALIQPDGRREAWSSGVLPSLPVLFLNNVLPRYVVKTWLATTVTETGWVSGAGLVITQDFFHELGGFDNDFFLYFEDVDLAQRAKQKNGFVGITPFFVLRHAGGKSHKSHRRMKHAFYESQKKYYAKWRPSYERLALSLLHKLVLR